MSYHERKAILDGASSLILTLAFSGYAYQRYLAEGIQLLQNPQFWGQTFLTFIVVSIIISIFMTIGFTIHYRLTTHETEPKFTDERDKLIELKATRNSYFAFVIGVLLSMCLIALNFPLYTMFIGLTYSGLAASLVDDVTQFYLYRRGF